MMALNKYYSEPSARMGILTTLSTIEDAAIVDFSTMGHSLYANGTFARIADYTKSLNLFSTHIDEFDISLGTTRRLRSCLQHIIHDGKYTVIFIIPSAISSITGVDLSMVAQDTMEEHPHIKIIPIDAGLSENASAGIHKTLTTLVEQLANTRENIDKHAYNILGSHVDIHKNYADYHEITRLLKNGLGLLPHCTLTADTTIAKIQTMSSASINIVLRHEALDAAKYLQNTFGTPYHYGVPYGIEGTTAWLEAIAKKLSVPLNARFIQDETDKIKQSIVFAKNVFTYNEKNPSARIIISGHSDTVRGINRFANELNAHTFVRCYDKQGSSEAVPYVDNTTFIERVLGMEGIVMASGAELIILKSNRYMQIANPSFDWRLKNPYELPFMGFVGAIHLAQLWSDDVLFKLWVK